MVRPSLRLPISRSHSRGRRIRKSRSRSIVSARIDDDGNIIPERIVSEQTTEVSVISGAEKRKKSKRPKVRVKKESESSDSEKTVYPGSRSRSRSPILPARRSRELARSPRIRSCLSNSPSRRRNPWRKVRQNTRTRRVSFAKKLTNSKSSSSTRATKSDSSSSHDKENEKQHKIGSRSRSRSAKKGRTRANRRLFN